MSQRFEYFGTCPECKTNTVLRDYEQCNNYCKKCGLVLGDLTFHDGNDAKTYGSDGSEEVRSTPHGRLGGNVGGNTRDMSSFQRARWGRLRRLDMRETAGAERAARDARKELDRICVGHNVPENVITYAENVYKKAAKKRVIKGRTVKTVLGVGIYEGFRSIGYPRSLDIVSDMCSITRNDLGKNVRFISRQLRLNVSAANAEAYVEPIANSLSLDIEVTSLAKEISRSTMNTQVMTGKNPVSIATGSILVAARMKNVKLSQTLLSKASGISCPTIKRISDSIELAMA